MKLNTPFLNNTVKEILFPIKNKIKNNMFKSLLNKPLRHFAKAPPSAHLSFEDLSRLISSKQIHTVNMGFPDHYGRLMGKRFDADFFLDSVSKDGAHACNYLLACDLNMDTPAEIACWESGYGDYHMVPDLKSLKPYWIPGHVVLMSDLHTDFHEMVEHAPRTILKKQIEKADKLGYTVNVASELEFFPFKGKAKKNWDSNYRNLKKKLNAQYPEDYNLLIGDRHEDLMYDIRKTLTQSGIKVETSKGEAACSQHEINIGYRLKSFYLFFFS